MRDLRTRLEEVLSSLGEKWGVRSPNARITLPEDLAHGDLSLNHALVWAREMRKAPLELARAIQQHVAQALEDVAEVSVAEAGFVNITLKDEALAALVREAVRNPQEWGAGEARKGSRVVVEYTQPNPFKAFHIGHLMSNTIGEALSRIIAAQGAEVIRANYQGDVGPHVAKALWALLQFPEEYNVESAQDLGRAYARGVEAYETDPEAKARIDDINRRLYELLAGEAPADAQEAHLLELYHKGREASLAHFAEIYHMLDTHFDAYFFESEAAPVGVALVRQGLQDGIFEESEGAVVFRGERCDPPLHTRVFLTRHGTPTYEAKELGLVALKLERLGPFDENITTVAVEQESYGRLIECVVARLWPELAGRYRFVVHGMLQLSRGKMSSRTGQVITGESLLAELRERAREKMRERLSPQKQEEAATAVAVAAVRFAVLRQVKGKNIRFDPEASLSLTGDSGPYVQYTHARLSSIVRKAQEKRVLRPDEGAPYAVLARALEGGAFTHLPDHARTVARFVVRFPLVLDRAHEELEPSHLAHYLLALAGAVNRWYDEEPIVREMQPHETLLRLAHLSAAQATIARGLRLLGIVPLEEM